MRALAAALLLALGCAVDSPAPKEQKSAPEPDGDRQAEAERTRTCPEGTCMAVPEGIRGLAFGMSREQARAAIGRLRRRRVKKRRVGSGDCRERLAMPGERFVASTSIGSEAARCELWFLAAGEGPGEAGGLSVIECHLDKRRDEKEHTETVWLLYHSLAKQYGKALSISDQLARRGRLKAIWKGPRAELILTAYRQGRRSSIELVNRSPRYASAVERQAERVKARCEAEAAARARARAEREARLRERAKGFEKDLRPPLERPQGSSN